MAVYAPPKQFIHLLTQTLNREGISIKRLAVIPYRYWQVTFPSGSEHFLSWPYQDLERWHIGTNRYKRCRDNVRNHMRLQFFLAVCLETYVQMLPN